MISLTRKLAVGAILVVLAPLACADAGHPLSLWEVSGARNSVYLLGSIHLLREEDHLSLIHI